MIFDLDKFLIIVITQKNYYMKNLIIDNAHSEIGFKVKHLMISTVKGNFTTFSGGVDEKGEVSVSINVNSINTGNADRDNHLKSADFFKAEEFPTMTFNSKNANLMSDQLLGELTIKGVTLPIVMDMEYNGKSVDPWGNTKHGFEINGVINRNNYGLTWNAPLETGGVLVSEDVKLSIDLQLMEVVEEMVTGSAE
jgi:polyisoprenoid-binding protein YceI